MFKTIPFLNFRLFKDFISLIVIPIFDKKKKNKMQNEPLDDLDRKRACGVLVAVGF